MNIAKSFNGPGSRGLTRLEVISLVAIVFLLGIVLVPAFGRAKQKAQRASCQCRLKQIGLSFRTWEGDFSNRYTMSVPIKEGGSKEWQAGTNMYHHFLTMSEQIVNPTVLTCPSDERKPSKDWASLRNKNLSYFLGLDADETSPAGWLSGDRNLETNDIPVKPGLVNITPGELVGWCRKMHHYMGNIALADGSVQQTSSNNLGTFLNGQTCVRLAVP